LGLFYIFYRFADPFVPKSCVQGFCVAAEKKEEERTNKQKKFLQFKKILLLKKKVVVTETKERKSKKKKEREAKSEYSCCYSKLILCDYICVQAHVSKQGLA
jgi:hypothetical protein